MSKVFFLPLAVAATLLLLTGCDSFNKAVNTVQKEDFAKQPAAHFALTCTNAAAADLVAQEAPNVIQIAMNIYGEVFVRLRSGDSIDISPAAQCTLRHTH